MFVCVVACVLDVRFRLLCFLSCRSSTVLKCRAGPLQQANRAEGLSRVSHGRGPPMNPLFDFCELISFCAFVELLNFVVLCLFLFDCLSCVILSMFVDVSSVMVI